MPPEFPDCALLTCVRRGGGAAFSTLAPGGISPRNDTVYTGEKTTLKKLDNRYGAKTVAQYSICDGPKRCWDAYKTTDG